MPFAIKYLIVLGVMLSVFLVLATLIYFIGPFTLPALMFLVIVGLIASAWENDERTRGG